MMVCRLLEERGHLARVDLVQIIYTCVEIVSMLSIVSIQAFRVSNDPTKFSIFPFCCPEVSENHGNDDVMDCGVIRSCCFIFILPGWQ